MIGSSCEVVNMSAVVSLHQVCDACLYGRAWGGGGGGGGLRWCSCLVTHNDSALSTENI